MDFPRFTYGAPPTVLTLSFTQKYWGTDTVADGGSDVSGSGLPARYVRRWDELAQLRLRFLDSEFLAVHSMWKACAGAPVVITFRFNATDPSTEFSVYLEKPSITDGFRPERQDSAPWSWELPMTLRSVNGTPLFVPISPSF